MRPEPFFSGAGIDRADQVRVDGPGLPKSKIGKMACSSAWRDGLPAIGATDGWNGSLRVVRFFLGIQDGAPDFSATEQPHANAGQLRHDRHASRRRAPSSRRPSASPGGTRGTNSAPIAGRHRESSGAGGHGAAPNCSAQHFPRVDPVVIMLAEHEGRLLLGRQPQYPPGRYSALAGFLEPGESIEAAVARELNEEAGIGVDDVSYIASQPWPFPRH